MTDVNCPHCGAPRNVGRRCDYCHVPYGMEPLMWGVEPGGIIYYDPKLGTPTFHGGTWYAPPGCVKETP